MNMVREFKDFLKDEVNLNPSRITLLGDRIEAVTNYLSDSEMFGPHFIDTIPQGSYAHKTIVKPVQARDGFDADILLHLKPIDGWEAQDYVQQLYYCFRRHHQYTHIAHRRTRCVKLDYAGDFHMDVVPYLEVDSEMVVTNTNKNLYHPTCPEVYNSWLDEQNRITGGHLVPVIRLMKFLRDFKHTFAVKSIILSILLGERVSQTALLADSDCYADTATALRTVINELSDYVLYRPYMPQIMDPGGSLDDFSERWHQDGWASFRDQIMRYADWIEDAYTEPDYSSSLRKWRKIFGDKFGQASLLPVVKAANLPAVTNTEQKLSDFGITIKLDPKYAFRVRGYVKARKGFPAYYLNDRGGKVMKDRTIRFEVDRCNIPEPFRLWWKVKNRGEYAIQQDCIRGQIEECDKIWRVEETTDFPGNHYVECFAIKNNVCVARSRQDVTIL